MRLPQAEEQLMKYLWKLEKAFMKDLLAAYPEPKPAKTTVSTLLKRLAGREFVGFHQRGAVREYYPKVSRRAYFASAIKGMIKQLFDDSTEQFASFFTENMDLSEEELEKLRGLVDQQLKDRR